MKHIVIVTFFAIITILIIKSSFASSAIPGLEKSRQLIVVISESWTDPKARLYRLERLEDGWRKLPGYFDAVIGSNGMAWDDAFPRKHDGTPVKKEGDRKAPAGMFHLVKVMGYAEAPPPGAAFPYAKIKEKTHCVDDKESRYYNQIINESDIPTPASELWKSSEIMRRKDILYKWLVVIDHNIKNPKPGAGSCIFIHVWRSPDKGTAGCTAMAEKDVVELVRWLKNDADPILVQLPQSVYEQHWRKWNLPAPDFYRGN